jgi:hypothetical protein
LARPTDHPEPANTLPPAELNPLLNPLLAQNMGRWAEVYFTSPPEKRDEAVLALLRELEGGPSAKNERPSDEGSKTMTKETVSSAGKVRQELKQFENGHQDEAYSVCPSCGRKNTADYTFCGMCGTLLGGTQAEALPAGPDPSFVQPLTTPAMVFRDAPAAELADEEFQLSHEKTYPSTSDADRNLRNISWLSTENVGQFQDPPEPFSVPYRYRIYIGAVLAIVIGALVYTAWRSTQVQSAGRHSLPQAASDTPAPAPARNPASAPVAATPTKTAQAASQTPQPKPQEAPAPAAAAPKLPAKALIPAAATPSRNLPAEPAQVISPHQGNGAEELAVAQGYLSSGNGKSRDSGEAAKWLWQSVRKQNGAATLMLSDLYLRGDGVPKNCDQARLLLDVAVRKSIAGAAERLRNLRAFGCQ